MEANYIQEIMAKIQKYIIPGDSERNKPNYNEVWEAIQEWHEKEIKQLEDRLNKIQMKVDEQAEDEGLWFNHKYITEGYLQRSLRELHKVVEGK